MKVIDVANVGCCLVYKIINKQIKTNKKKLCLF